MSLLAARSRLPSGCPAARLDGAQKHVSVRRSHASCSSISEGEQRARHSYSSPDGRVPVPPQRQHEWQPKIGSLVASRPVLAHTQAMAMRCGHCGGQHESVADVRECSGENTDPSFSSTPPVDQDGRLLCQSCGKRRPEWRLHIWKPQRDIFLVCGKCFSEGRHPPALSAGQLHTGPPPSDPLEQLLGSRKTRWWRRLVRN